MFRILKKKLVFQSCSLFQELLSGFKKLFIFSEKTLLEGSLYTDWKPTNMLENKIETVYATSCSEDLMG